MLTSVIQSLFGVGVLLFGTPWMLLLGYDFVPTLFALLPVSLTISALQLMKERHLVDVAVLRGIATLTLPTVAATLWLATRRWLHIDAVIAVFVILAALQNTSTGLKQRVDGLVGRTKTYMVLMGAVHGLSNLGGSMLTVLVYSRDTPKTGARATIAAGYALFGMAQLATVALVAEAWPPATRILLYMLTGAAVFVATERLLFPRLQARSYKRGLAALLLATGVLLLFKTLRLAWIVYG